MGLLAWRDHCLVAGNVAAVLSLQRGCCRVSWLDGGAAGCVFAGRLTFGVLAGVV